MRAVTSILMSPLLGASTPDISRIKETRSSQELRAKATELVRNYELF